MLVTGVGFCCIDSYESLSKHYPTGNSVDFAIHLSRMGIQTSMVSVVGNDEYGRMMADVLVKEKVDISHLHVAEGHTAIFKMELNGNDRVHKEKVEGVMGGFRLTEEDKDFISRHNYLHTNLSGRITDHLSAFRQAGVRIIFDFSVRMNEEASQYLPHVDYAFFSCDRYKGSVEDYLMWAKGLGPQVVVATMGERGSIAYDGEAFHREGIVPVEVVNTVGAGDSFCAGFMYGVMNGRSIPESLRIGAETAAEVITKFEPY